MASITIDASLSDKLASLTGDAAIQDSSGRLVGIFRPATEYERRLYQEAMKHCDPEEMERRAKNPGKCLTTAELLDQLRALKPE